MALRDPETLGLHSTVFSWRHCGRTATTTQHGRYTRPHLDACARKLQLHACAGSMRLDACAPLPAGHTRHLHPVQHMHLAGQQSSGVFGLERTAKPAGRHARQCMRRMGTCRRQSARGLHKAVPQPPLAGLWSMPRPRVPRSLSRRPHIR